jgi:gamma-glutamylcyclotransferase (GGCT)/AIG2-like uncharacterized protein YtfP
MSEYVFVYGSLKRGGGLSDYMDWSRGTFLGEAALTGVELYLLPAGFPAAVPAADGIAYGELWRVKSLVILDQIEGNGHHYQREQRSFQTSNGVIQAWVYMYLLDIRPTDLPLVSGVYPTDLEEVHNLLCEWATAYSRKTPFDDTGFDVYEENSDECYMPCDDCPFKERCNYSDFDLTTE